MAAYDQDIFVFPSFGGNSARRDNPVPVRATGPLHAISYHGPKRRDEPSDDWAPTVCNSGFHFHRASGEFLTVGTELVDRR